MTNAWVICKDYGTDGLNGPFLVFLGEAAAKQFMARFSALSDTPVKLVVAELVDEKTLALNYPPGVRGPTPETPWK